MPRFLAGLSSGVRASWFEAAFAVPHLPWRLLMRSWAQGQDLSRPGQDGTDGSSGPTPLRLPFYQRSIVPDPTSEIVASDEHWRQMWAWLPEWVTCENPFCVFRASRDGYKCVSPLPSPPPPLTLSPLPLPLLPLPLLPLSPLPLHLLPLSLPPSLSSSLLPLPLPPPPSHPQPAHTLPQE